MSAELTTILSAELTTILSAEQLQNTWRSVRHLLSRAPRAMSSCTYIWFSFWCEAEHQTNRPLQMSAELTTILSAELTTILSAELTPPDCCATTA